jgi:predicted transcriptional regulator
MPDDDAWGRKIKERREELGMTSDELGARIGRHRSMVHRYEDSEIDLRRSVMLAIADALDSHPCDLFFPEQAA